MCGSFSFKLAQGFVLAITLFNLSIGQLLAADEAVNKIDSASTTVGEEQPAPEDEFDIFDMPIKTQKRLASKFALSAQANELAESLEIKSSMTRLNSLHEKYSKSKSQSNNVEIMLLQNRLSRKIQHASLQLQETFANIDGDLAQTNMLLAYASSRRDRSLLYTNVATFTGSGTFGILGAGANLGSLSPANDILSILGFSTAVLLPLWSLRTPRYTNPRHSQPRLNMLAPIFEENSSGAGFEPIVWHYIQSVPPASTSHKTRRELLIESWKSYRGFGAKESESARREATAEIVNAPSKEKNLTIEALKTRAELLIDLRALVQAMYRDISELDTACLKL